MNVDRDFLATSLEQIDACSASNTMYFIEAIQTNQSSSDDILSDQINKPFIHLGGRTPLTYAIKNGLWRSARLLIERGANIAQRDARGVNPVAAMSFWQRTEIFSMCIDAYFVFRTLNPNNEYLN